MVELTEEKSMVLKVHVEIETGGGERIAEFRVRKEYFHFLSADEWRRGGDGRLQQLLDADVVGPARVLVVAHIHKGNRVMPSHRVEPLQPYPEMNPAIEANAMVLLEQVLQQSGAAR